ncbi:hypothetical protein N9L92_02130 [Saprospiraceae bacterium]|nr:hypothetical protein [Saprospiraceae bacterium]
MKPTLKILIFFFATFISFNFMDAVQEKDCLQSNVVANTSCDQLSQNEFILYPGDPQGCLLFGNINFKGKLEIDINRFDSAAKVYYWWTTDQFLIKSDIKELDDKNLISIPNSSKARLHVKTELDSAHLTINELILKK